MPALSSARPVLGLPMGILLLTSFAAAGIPAWRAAHVAPIVALRNE